MKDNKTNLIFKSIGFALLLLLTLTLPIMTLCHTISKSFSIPDGLYAYNCFLCVSTYILFGCYLIYRFTNREKNSKKSWKERFQKYWPIILLAVFMVWTGVGCYQAGMEMDAEIYIKQAKNIDDVPQRIQDIANWSPTDRMANTSNRYQNAKDRAWDGCNNLKDGYFSFLYYGAVFLSILLISSNNDKNFKKWIMRALLMTSFLMILLNIVSVFSPTSFANGLSFKKMLFNHDNHFAYYITVVLIMSVGLAITEKNLYFKIISIANCLLYFPMLLFNDTFGAYLGVACAMIFLFFVTLIRLVSRKKVAQFVIYLFCLAMFVTSSFVIGNAKCGGYSANKVGFTYSEFLLNFGNKQYFLIVNSLSEEQAKENHIEKFKMNGQKLYWGVNLIENEKIIETNVPRNFRKLFADINKLFKFYKETDDNLLEQMTQEEFDKKVAEIKSKFPKVSGESIIENKERLKTINEELQKFYEENDLLDEDGNLKKLFSEKEMNTKSGLTNEVATIGQKRGEIWIRSLDLMNQRPMFGWGLENILNEFNKQYGINEGRTHCLVLQLGATVGIPGLLIYLVATISIFLKNIYDVKLRKFGKKGIIVITSIYAISTIVLNIAVCSVTDKLFINGVATVLLWVLLYAIIFVKNVKLRIKDWNEFELIGCGVFVSYMISSIFGNSAFYSSPYFMIFLGILASEMLYKTSRFDEEEIKDLDKKETKKFDKKEAKKLDENDAIIEQK